MCGTDLYEEIKSRYGSEFTNYVLSEKSKGFISAEVSEAKIKLTTNIEDVRTKAMHQIEERRELVLKDFEGCKKEIEGTVPGGVRAVETAHEKELDQLLGLRQPLQLFKEARDKVNKKLMAQEKQALAELDNTLKEEINQEKDRQPDLALVEQLKPGQRQEVLKKASEELYGLIKDREAQIHKSLAEKLNTAKYATSIEEFVSADGLDGVVTIACNKFQEEKRQLLASGGTPKGP